MHFFGDFLWVERLGGFRRLLDDLHAGIAVKGVGFRLELLRAKFLHDLFRIRLVARIGTVSHQRAFDTRSTDGGKFVRCYAVAAHQRRLHSLVAHLAHDQAAFGVEAAPIDEIGARLLDLGHKRRKVLLAGVHAFIKHFLYPAFVDRLLGFIGETFAICRLVVNDRDFLALEMFRDVFARHLPLLIVATADAEDVPHLALGYGGVGRGRSDLEYAVFLIDLRRWNRDTRVVVTDDKFDPVTGEFVGNGNALFGIGGVISVGDGDFLAKNAAGSVDVGSGLIDAIFHLGAGRRTWAGDRSAYTEFDLGTGRPGRGDRNAQGEAKGSDLFHL